MAESATNQSTNIEFGVREALSKIIQTFSRRELGIFVIYTALLFSILNSIDIFVQPISVNIANINPVHIGLLYAAFRFISAIGASQSGQIKRRFGSKSWFTIAPPLLGLLMVVTVFFPVLALPMLLFTRFGRSISGPLENQYINDRIQSIGRATVLSSKSMVRSMISIPLLAVSGAMATRTTLLIAVSLLGGLLLLSSLIAVIFWKLSELH